MREDMLEKYVNKIIMNTVFRKGDKKFITKILIKKSNIPNAGYGAFAMSNIPKGYSIPYIGKFTKRQPVNSIYTWEVEKYNKASGEPIDGKPYAFIDAIRTTHWTKYVNSPDKSENACFDVYQKRDKIYYKTNREIKKGEELLVWYGHEYYDEYCKPKK